MSCGTCPAPRAVCVHGAGGSHALPQCPRVRNTEARPREHGEALGVCEGAPVSPRAAAVSLHPIPLPGSARVPRGTGVPAHMDVQLHVLPLAEPCELVTAMKHRESKSGGAGETPLKTHLGGEGPFGLVWGQAAPPGTPIWEKRDPRSDLGVRRDLCELLVWGQTPLELLRRDPWPLSGLEEPGPQWDGTPWSVPHLTSR